MSHSPTGYWAHYTIQLPADRAEQVYPVLRWDDDGRPVISNYGGHLVTVAAHGRDLENGINEAGGGCYVNWTVTPEA